MKYSMMLLIGCLVIMPASHSYAQEAEQEFSFTIVIHASNPHTSLKAKDISKLFLKKIQVWEQTDEKVLPVDLPIDSP